MSHYGEAGICDAVLVDVKDELWVLDHVHPEPQWQAVREVGEVSQSVHGSQALLCVVAMVNGRWESNVMVWR